LGKAYRTIYFDAFAGTGKVDRRKRKKSSLPELVHFPEPPPIDGSALRALQVDPPFQKYIEPEPVKMGCLPGWEIKAVGTAKWTLLPERHRVPKVFLDASVRTNFESVVGVTGLGFEFSDRWLKINFARTRAFDLDPQRRAGSDETAPESNVLLIFGGHF